MRTPPSVTCSALISPFPYAKEDGYKTVFNRYVAAANSRYGIYGFLEGEPLVTEEVQWDSGDVSRYAFVSGLGDDKYTQEYINNMRDVFDILKELRVLIEDGKEEEFIDILKAVETPSNDIAVLEEVISRIKEVDDFEQVNENNEAGRLEKALIDVLIHLDSKYVSALRELIQDNVPNLSVSYIDQIEEAVYQQGLQAIVTGEREEVDSAPTSHASGLRLTV